jgi:2,3-dihydroxybenzoate-AMP ligase
MRPGCVAWPDEFAERYRSEGHWRGETLGDLLRAWARAHGAREALVAGAQRWTYAELDARADRVAAGLLALGLAPGDRVVVQLPNHAEFVPLCFAMFRLGVLPVFALPAHRRSEVVHIAETAKAVAYVVPAVHLGFDYRALAAEVRARVPSLRHVVVAGGDPGAFTPFAALDGEPREFARPDPGDAAFFLLSGGTTGLPKLIARTHDDYACNVRACADVAALGAGDVYLAALPIAHNFALGCPGIVGTLSRGGRVVLTTDPSAEAAFSLIARERVTVTALVPPLAVLWMQAAAESRYDLSSLRLVQVGGARIKPEHARRVRGTLGCTLQQSFGMAEGLLIQTRPDDTEEIVVETQGRPVCAADEFRIVDAEERDVAPGTVGDLLARGPYTIRGYYRAPEHNARAFTPDGFFRTGDRAYVTPSGNVVMAGRSNDVINRGGEKVSAEEVEAHLLAHPRVLDAAVVAMPDELMGERTCAFVVPRDGPPRLGELAAFLRERGLAAYKLPDRLECVPALPSTSVGKVSKAALRETLAAKLAAERAARAR